MMFDGATPFPAGAGDPTWYLVWDLVGTWLGAFGTVAATFVAVWLGVKASRDQRAQREEQARAQAEQVSLVRRWIDGGVFLQIRNESERAITAVHIMTEGALRDEAEHQDSTLDVIPPHEAPEIYFQGVKDRGLQAAAAFDDAAGRSWVRTSDGRLVRVFRDPNHPTIEGRYDDKAAPDTVKHLYIQIFAGALKIQLTPGWPPHADTGERHRLFEQTIKGVVPAPRLAYMDRHSQWRRRRDARRALRDLNRRASNR